ncbi:hypothetical protein, partial [Actinomadura harenae]
MGSRAPGTETAGENTETVAASETPQTAARTGTTEPAGAVDAGTAGTATGPPSARSGGRAATG